MLWGAPWSGNHQSPYVAFTRLNLSIHCWYVRFQSYRIRSMPRRSEEIIKCLAVVEMLLMQIMRSITVNRHTQLPTCIQGKLPLPWFMPLLSPRVAKRTGCLRLYSANISPSPPLASPPHTHHHRHHGPYLASTILSHTRHYVPGPD